MSTDPVQTAPRPPSAARAETRHDSLGGDSTSSLGGRRLEPHAERPRPETRTFDRMRDDLRRRCLRMATLVEELVRDAGEALFNNSLARAEAVVRRDNIVDAEEVAVEREVLRLLGLRHCGPEDLRMLTAALKVNNDLERIADCAVNIAQRAHQVGARIPDPAEREMRLMEGLTRQMLRWAVQAYGNGDLELARRVMTTEETVDALSEKVIQLLTNDISENCGGDGDLLVPDLDLIIIAKNIERIADHSTNVAEDVIFMVTGEIVRHTDAWQRFGRPASPRSPAAAPVRDVF